MKKLWKIGQTKAISLEFTYGRVTAELYVTWLGLVFWGALLTWILW